MPLTPPIPLNPSPVRLPRLAPGRDAASPPPAISGGTLAVQPDGRVAVAADPDRDAVYVIDTSQLLARSLALPAGSEPGRVVLDDRGRAHVALRSAGAIARIDLTSASVEKTQPVCQFPRGLAYDAARASVWVACADGPLVQLDSSTYSERSRSIVARDLRDVLVSDSGTVLVSRYRSAELLRVGADGSLESRAAPPSLNIPVSTDDQSHSPELAWRTINGPGGVPWMLHQRAQNGEVQLPPLGDYGGNLCERIMQPGLTRFDAAGLPDSSIRLPRSLVLGVDLASTWDGSWFAVADPSEYLPAEPTIRLLSGAQLAKDAIGRGEDKTWTHQDLCEIPPTPSLVADGQATSVAFDRAGLLYVLSREPAKLEIFDLSNIGDAPASDILLAPAHTIALDPRSVRDAGHELFHSATASGLSCASCHGEALDDGHVWRFLALGSRRTQNIRGGILQTLPLHWDGDMPDVSALMANVWSDRMHGIALNSTFQDALGSWLDRQPALRLNATDAAAAQRGQQLFESSDLACATCHSGPAFTNNQNADVGTGAAFQVPSLRGLGLRAPYMHDGCAQTLADRFTQPCGGDERHGHTSQLSGDQQRDLIAYLDTL
jgi:mono/diheme cytochrome c family protein